MQFDTVVIRDASRRADLTFLVTYERDGDQISNLRMTLQEWVLWFGAIGIPFNDLLVEPELDPLLKQCLQAEYEGRALAQIWQHQRRKNR